MTEFEELCQALGIGFGSAEEREISRIVTDLIMADVPYEEISESAMAQYVLLHQEVYA